jgi:zinc finger protein 830
MADVRALLKAKRQEARITHPYAAYGANGALRCTACGAAIKFASAWEGHLGSKAHRVAVANLKANAGKEEGARVTNTTAAVSKRKVQEEDGGEGAGGEEGQTKRQRTVEREIAPPDGADDADAHADASHSFPVDFFSDPARALARTSADDGDDDDDDAMDQDGDGNAKTTAPAPEPEPKSQFDAEWAAFEREMQRRPAGGGAEETTTKTTTKTKTKGTTSYAHATIAAEPELVPRFEGLPVSDDGAAQETAGGVVGVGVEGEAGARKGAGEAEERRRKERDERELIMDRLVEEERAQEDAYGRVALLKNRVQMLKQKRELAKAKGTKTVDMET